MVLTCIAATDKNSTPLHQAVLAGNFDVLERLLESGVDPSLKDKFGHTALSLILGTYFKSESNPYKREIPYESVDPMIDLLIKFGSPIHTPKIEGWSPYELAKEYGEVKLKKNRISCF